MSGVLRDILIRERAAIMNMVLSCTEKQYERLVEKELEQQDKTIKEQEKKLKAGEKQLRAGERKLEEQEKQLRAGEKKMEEQERLLKLNRILVREKKYELLERIQDDPELQKELIEQYGI